MKHFRLLIGLLFVALGASANEHYVVQHYSIKDGMSQNTVMAIMQDKQGFMWFGTWDGLNRFDGYEFVTFKAMRNGEEAQVNNRVELIYEDDREHVIYNVVNGLLLRPYCSGKPWILSPENWALYREGMEVYKSIRSRTCRMTPFFPLGFTTFKSPVLAYGLRDEKGAYLSVFAPYTDHAAIPLDHVPELTDVRVLYPVHAACDYAIRDGNLQVQLPQAGCARTFELRRKKGTK